MFSTAFLLIAPLSAQQPDTRGPATGRWDLKITATDGVLPSWLEVQKSGNTALVGRFVAVVGSARPISQIIFERDTLRFSIPPQWEQGKQDLAVEAAVTRHLRTERQQGSPESRPRIARPTRRG